MPRVVASLTVLLGLLAGCGSDAVDTGVSAEDRQELIDDLIDNREVDPDDAKCAIDGQIAEFGARILDPTDTPTEAEVDRLVEIWDGCGLLDG